MSGKIRVWEVLIIEQDNQDKMNEYFSGKKFPGSSRPIALASRGFFIEGIGTYAASMSPSSQFYFLNGTYIWDIESDISETAKEIFENDIYNHRLEESDGQLFPYGYWEKVDYKNKKLHEFDCEYLTGEDDKDREFFKSKEFEKWIKDEVFEYLNGNNSF